MFGQHILQRRGVNVFPYVCGTVVMIYCCSCIYLLIPFHVSSLPLPAGKQNVILSRCTKTREIAVTSHKELSVFVAHGGRGEVCACADCTFFTVAWTHLTQSEARPWLCLGIRTLACAYGCERSSPSVSVSLQPEKVNCMGVCLL